MPFEQSNLNHGTNYGSFSHLRAINPDDSFLVWG